MPPLDTPVSEWRIALGHAPSAVREPLTVLFALDARLGGIVSRAREPGIALMRLVWWRDALAALDDAPPPAEPLLIAVAALRGRGVTGGDLAAMAEGWEVLLDDADLGADSAALHARERGGRLFALGGRLLGDADARLVDAGEGWALADIARYFAPPARRGALLDLARAPLDRAMATRWPARLRPLGMLGALALQDVRRGGEALLPPASRRRLIRLLWHRWSGR